MFDRVFRVIDLEHTKGDKQISIHVEGKTVEEVKELFNHAWEHMKKYEG